ncbi:TIGR02449 family protein [Candidatus Parabeggiatoa sp. HSG14]|uniref:TIGR02449 family protein n=1 Tax=Candidatus Parabeggiatoa sp. HSG14 TaxID=3055593 RepID=UPI0025A7B8F6|nr:TIGR02449 family protein [Thiotrichales bacterium HSG14]
MEKSNYLQSLETKIDTLIHLCKQLTDENKALRESQTHLMSERAALLEKNTLARTRIEAMVARLKSMEVST